MTRRPASTPCPTARQRHRRLPRRPSRTSARPAQPAASRAGRRDRPTSITSSVSSRDGGAGPGSPRKPRSVWPTTSWRHTRGRSGRRQRVGRLRAPAREFRRGRRREGALAVYGAASSAATWRSPRAPPATPHLLSRPEPIQGRQGAHGPSHSASTQMPPRDALRGYQYRRARGHPPTGGCSAAAPATIFTVSRRRCRCRFSASVSRCGTFAGLIFPA